MRHKLSLASSLLLSSSLFFSTVILNITASSEAYTLHNSLYNSLTIDGFVKLDVFRVYFNDSSFDEGFIKRAMGIREGRVTLVANFGNWAIDLGSYTDEGPLAEFWAYARKDAECLVTYSGFNGPEVSFGIMRPEYGLEASQSRLNGTFMEKSIAAQMFAPDNRAAVTISGGTDNFSGGASVFLTDANYSFDYNFYWQYGFAARGFYNNIQPQKTWSLGLSFYYEDNSGFYYDSDMDQVYFPGSGDDEGPGDEEGPGGEGGGGQSTRVTKMNTFPLSNTSVGFSSVPQKANNYASLGGVFVAGDKSAQAEIFYNLADTAVTKLSWYVQGAWVVTGEAREFDASTGTLGSVVASNSANGAVELALRADYLYISGAAKNEYAYTLGANYYINSKVKMQANLVVASIDNDAIVGTGDDDKYVIGAGLRAQVSF